MTDQPPTTLPEWVAWAIAHTRQVAEAAAHEMGDAPQWWTENTTTVAIPFHDAYTGSTKGFSTVVTAGPDVGRPVIEHIALNDPATVIRQCDMHQMLLRDCGEYEDMESATDGLAERALEYLAACYSHLPGYRQEWAP